jgi:hypothetical protein
MRVLAITLAAGLLTATLAGAALAESRRPCPELQTVANSEDLAAMQMELRRSAVHLDLLAGAVDRRVDAEIDEAIATITESYEALETLRTAAGVLLGHSDLLDVSLEVLRRTVGARGGITGLQADRWRLHETTALRSGAEDSREAAEAIFQQQAQARSEYRDRCRSGRPGSAAGAGLPPTPAALVEEIVGAFARKDIEAIRALYGDPEQGRRICPSAGDDQVEDLRRQQSGLERGFGRVSGLDWVDARRKGTVEADLEVSSDCADGLPWGSIDASYVDRSGMFEYALHLYAYSEEGGVGLGYVDDFHVYYSDEAVAAFERIKERAFDLRFTSGSHREPVSLLKDADVPAMVDRCRAVDEEWGCSFRGKIVLDGRPAGTFLVFFTLEPGGGWKYKTTVRSHMKERESDLLHEVGRELRKLQAD